MPCEHLQHFWLPARAGHVTGCAELASSSMHLYLQPSGLLLYVFMSPVDVEALGCWCMLLLWQIARVVLAQLVCRGAVFCSTVLLKQQAVRMVDSLAGVAGLVSGDWGVVLEYVLLYCFSIAGCDGLSDAFVDEGQ